MAPSSSSPSETARGSPSFSDSFADLVAEARRCATAGQFLRAALTAIGRHFACPYGALYVRYASEVIQEEFHYGPTDPRFWKESVQSFLTDSLAEPRPRAKLLRSRSDQTRIAFISAPVFDPTGPAIGAMAFVVSPGAESDLTSLLAILESMTRLTSFAVEFVGRSGQTESVTTAPVGAGIPAAQSQALRRAATCSSLAELAFSLTNELCNKLACEQVALGIVQGGSVRIISLSGLDSVSARSPGVAVIRAAMEECLDAEAIIVDGGGSDWSGGEGAEGYRLHHQWRAAARGDAVASMPLMVDSQVVAIAGFRRRAEQPFGMAQLTELRSKVEPYAAALQLLRRAERGVARHAADWVSGGIRALVRPGHIGAKIIAAGAVIGLAIALFGTMSYKVSVSCVVKPAAVRHLASPYDAMIASAVYMAGDHVSMGDVLAELDHRDLDQQRAELQAESAVLEKTMDRALAVEEKVEYQLAAAQQRLVQTKLDIVDRRLAQAQLRAPFDGMVVRGDLRKRVGTVVARGEPLFEVAPLTSWTLELQIPEFAAADVAAGQRGIFASFARPDRQIVFQVNRVLESAQVMNGRNVMVAEAEIAGVDDLLRPGMEGVARVQIGSRRIWWVALHRAFDYLRLSFWL